jgi:hypothetical protein
VLAVVWPVALFAAVSCMRLKLAWYVYPAYPVLAISIGSLAVSAIGRLHRAVRARVPALTVVAIALLVALVVTRLDATITRSNRPGIPILVQRWVAFLSEPTQASWRLAWLDLDPGLDLDDPTFYYLHRLRDRTERFADAEALGVALEREPDRPTLVLVGPRYPLPATLAARSVARMTLAMPYGAELTVLAFGALDPARIPLRRS